MTRLSFVRSGGLVAAPGLLVRADVTFDASGGEVSTVEGYRRPLEPAEAAALIAATEGVAVREAADLKSAPAADAFRYEMTIERAGKPLTLRGDASSVDPSIVRLVTWVSAEADRILQWRARL
jgi:hypothetical protein